MDIKHKVDLYNWLVQAPVPDFKQLRLIKYDEVDPNTGNIVDTPGHTIDLLISNLLEQLGKPYNLAQAQVRQEPAPEIKEAPPAYQPNPNALPSLQDVAHLISEDRNVGQYFKDLLDGEDLNKGFLSRIFKKYPWLAPVFDKYAVNSDVPDNIHLNRDLRRAELEYLERIVSIYCVFSAYCAYNNNINIGCHVYSRLPEEYKQLFVKTKSGYAYSSQKSPLGDQLMIQLRAQYKYL